MSGIFIDLDLIPFGEDEPRCSIGIDFNSTGEPIAIDHNGKKISMGMSLADFFERVIGQGYIAQKLANAEEVDPFTEHKRKVELALQRGES